MLFVEVPASAADVTPRLDAQVFRPAIGLGSLLWVDLNGTAADPRVFGRMLMSYAKDPLIYDSGTGSSRALVSDVLEAHWLGGLSLGPTRLGVHLPLYVDQRGAEGQGPGLGDLGLDGRLILLDPQRAPFGFGVGGRLSLPTSTVANPLGSPGLAGEVTGTLDLASGPLRIGLNGGWWAEPAVAIPDLRLDDFVVGRLGAAYALGGGTGLTAETAWRMSVPWTARPSGEWLVGGWSEPTRGAALHLAGGTGLANGVGTPTFRLVAGLDLHRAPAPPDLDHDGLVGDADACPEEPEDLDGFADADGCPDPDDDGDGIVDWLDSCRRAPEDLDGVQDTDGCPDPEVAVRVRLVDRDGSPATRVMTSIGGEDRGAGPDYYVELMPGTYAVAATGQGYEPTSQDVVVADKAVNVKLVLPPQHLHLEQAVGFATNRAYLLPSARPALEQIAAFLRDHPEIEVLRIEGHTDSRGDAVYNLDLSERRAAAVKGYLVDLGIAPERLVDQGYGESRPIDPRPVAEAWAVNRRVELIVE